MRIQTFRWLGALIRFGLGGLLLWTSIPKMTAPAEFLSSIYGYELLGPQLASVLAVVLPWTEFLTGMCLLGGVYLPGALLACMALFTIFTLAQASVLHRGLSIDCGCGLPGDEHVTYSTLVRSLLLLIAALVAYLCLSARRESAADTSSAPAQTLA